MDVRQEITDKIILALEKGVKPWKCPFEKVSLPVNYKTKHTYNGINTLSLWLTSLFQGYTSNYWMGFAQAKTLGGKVRKGEKGTPIIVCQATKKKIDNNESDEDIITRFYKTDYVFNLDQIDSLELEIDNNQIKPIETFDKMIQDTGVVIRHQGERAYFDIENDFINMPFKSKFKDESGYYSTLSHEITHWTGHKDRLNRINLKGKADRAFEELVAEIGASFLCSEFGITPDIENTASYLDSWLENLKKDKTYIFKAAGEANKAISYIQGDKYEAKQN